MNLPTPFHPVPGQETVTLCFHPRQSVRGVALNEMLGRRAIWSSGEAKQRDGDYKTWVYLFDLLPGIHCLPE